MLIALKISDYIKNEDGDWDTSSAFLRKTITRCVELGRSGLSDERKHKDWWEALRLLGQTMHVMVCVFLNDLLKIRELIWVHVTGGCERRDAATCKILLTSSEVYSSLELD